MRENLITTYMIFKLECLKKYSMIIGKDLIDKEICNEYFNKYFTSYINTVYYHILGTLNYEKDMKYNQTTINKELEGMYEEIVYDIDNSDIIEDVGLYKKR